MELTELGWNVYFSELFKPFAQEGLSPARVVCEDRRIYTVCCETGEYQAEVAGKLAHSAQSPADFPAVGDWAALCLPTGGGRAIVHSVLPRRSAFSRKTASVQTDEQVVAANVDTVLLVCALDGEFNIRRLERYLLLSSESGAEPVIVLNKADLCATVSGCVREVRRVAANVQICVVSATDRLGLDTLSKYLARGRTVAFLGSSGVGKSSLINALLGMNRQETGSVRESDRRGKHTTTRRELIRLPGGAMVIDSPGMRELQMWADEESLDSAFEDIAQLAQRCRFRDCRHMSEPGCAVQAAAEAGKLDPGRLRNYLKLSRELSGLVKRRDMRQKLNSRKRKTELDRRLKMKET